MQGHSGFREDHVLLIRDPSCEVHGLWSSLAAELNTGDVSAEIVYLEPRSGSVSQRRGKLPSPTLQMTLVHMSAGKDIPCSGQTGNAVPRPIPVCVTLATLPKGSMTQWE